MVICPRQRAEALVLAWLNRNGSSHCAPSSAIGLLAQSDVCAQFLVRGFAGRGILTHAGKKALAPDGTIVPAGKQ